MFSCEICEILKHLFLQNASGGCFWSFHLENISYIFLTTGFSNHLTVCIKKILFKIVIKINISVVNFLRCHYNPSWCSQKFLGLRICWADSFDLEFLKIPHTFWDKVYILIRNAFSGNTFPCWDLLHLLNFLARLVQICIILTIFNSIFH